MNAITKLASEAVVWTKAKGRKSKSYVIEPDGDLWQVTMTPENGVPGVHRGLTPGEANRCRLELDAEGYVGRKVGGGVMQTAERCPCCLQLLLARRLGMASDEFARANALGMDAATHSYLAGADFNEEVNWTLETVRIVTAPVPARRGTVAALPHPARHRAQLSRRYAR